MTDFGAARVSEEDVRENTRRNMEKHNIPRGVGLPEIPPVPEPSEGENDE